MPSRRQFVASAGLATFAALFGKSGTGWAFTQSRNAFDARTVDALYQALGVPKPTASSLITLDVPDVAENGAHVPIRVNIALPNVERALVIAEHNRFPLLADVRLYPRCVPWFEAKIKLAESTTVSVITEADGKLYSTSRFVKVIVGGCHPG